MYCRGNGVFYWHGSHCSNLKKKKKKIKGTKKPNVYAGALVCTTGAWVLFIGTVAIVQTKKKKKTQ